MIDMYTARTSEIDEVDEALEEIMSQLDLSVLKQNSCGLIFCHIEFVESGVVEALCEALPFNVIGMTSMVGADEHGYGLYDLTVTILTSDEVSFAAGMTNDIDNNNYVDEVDALWSSMRSRVDDDPKLIISFMPYISEVAGYEVLAAMDQAAGGIPMWGSITNNIDFNYETVQTICNGKSLRKGLAMMFLNGSVEPTFIVSSIPERNITDNRALITKSERAIIHEINDMPFLDYFANVGLTITRENITTNPVMVYYEGADEPVALGFYTLFDDGSVLAGGEMPPGTSIAVSYIDAEGIFESAEAGLARILSIKDRQATLLLPCVTRYIMLAPDQESELRLISERLLGDGKPFMMGYSGGEVCPMPDKTGKLKNRFHNYSFSALVL